jgi:hypothetical protein
MLGRNKPRVVDNIRKNVTEVGKNYAELIYVSQERERPMANNYGHGNKTCGSIKCLEYIE